MFTGIIEELGQVREISLRGKVTVLSINASLITQDTKIGDSISVNGVCLTAVLVTPDRVKFEAISETLKNTNLDQLRIGDKVNLERSLKVGERISGHFVSGHVDCTGIIRKRGYRNANLGFDIAVSLDYIRYCLPKGSIAIDGISLTIAQVRSGMVTVYIIPHTEKQTTLGARKVSDKVNLEFDILAKGNVKTQR